MVFIASNELVLAMAVELVPVEYRERYRAMEPSRREGALDSYVRKIRHGKTLMELTEIARVATMRLTEDSLIELAKALQYDTE